MTNLLSTKSVLAALGAAVLLLAVPASAQSAQMRVDIPFSFVAGEQVLPAGEYRIDLDTTLNAARLQLASTGEMVFLRFLPVTTSRPLAESDRAIVRFAKAGDRYLLTGVWQRGATEGNTLPQSRRWKEAAKTAPVRDITPTGSEMP